MEAQRVKAAAEKLAASEAAWISSKGLEEKVLGEIR